MQVIYKYPLISDPNDVHRFSVNVPGNLDIVHFGPDANRVICLWLMAESENDAPPVNYEIVRIGTGWVFDGKSVDRHLGTLIDHPFVWHYFLKS